MINRSSLSLLARTAAAGFLAGLLLFVPTRPVAAECDGPIPSFRDALSTAQRVIVGDVTEVTPSDSWDSSMDGRSSRFTLRVRHVLRGDAPPVLWIRDLPTQPCAPVVVARPGDRIAIAFDAMAFQPPTRVNTVAWIRGEPVFEGIETTTLTETLSLMGLVAPDTSTSPGPGPSQPPFGMLAVTLAGIVATLMAAYRRLTPPRPGS